MRHILATARAPGTFTGDINTATGWATAAQEQLEYQGTPTAGPPELMETPVTEWMLTTVGTPATPGTTQTSKTSKT